MLICRGSVFVKTLFAWSSAQTQNAELTASDRATNDRFGGGIGMRRAVHAHAGRHRRRPPDRQLTGSELQDRQVSSPMPVAPVTPPSVPTSYDGTTAPSRTGKW